MSDWARASLATDTDTSPVQSVEACGGNAGSRDCAEAGNASSAAQMSTLEKATVHCFITVIHHLERRRVDLAEARTCLLTQGPEFSQ
ncbi:hypothetical protein [Candidatus Poriferisodalis sp.]|uniref:hypothetical protein n=1 Tax=Candidatus Poriferisodalis sp. TaxID=3101277 RepID=UPI003B598D2D